MDVKPRGTCPECGSTLRRTGRDGHKGRYQCTNYDRCSNRKWYNRYGEPR